MVSAGMLGGFLAGLLGIGGGIIYIFIFTEFIVRLYGDIGLTESDMVKMTIANTIFTTTFASLSGVIKHYRMDNFDIKTVLPIAIPASIACILVTYLLTFITYSKTTFSILFVILLFPLIYRMLTTKKEEKKISGIHHIKKKYFILVGIFSGSMTALSGLGGGFAIVPFLNNLFKVEIHKVVSISLGVIFCVAFSNTIFQLFFNNTINNIPYTYGSINILLSFPVIIGVLLAAPLGVMASKKLSPYTIRMLFVGFCMLLIIKILYNVI